MVKMIRAKVPVTSVQVISRQLLRQEKSPWRRKTIFWFMRS